MKVAVLSNFIKKSIYKLPSVCYNSPKYILGGYHERDPTNTRKDRFG